MSFLGPPDRGMAEEPVSTGSPALLACAAGIVGSMPIGVAAGLVARWTGGDSNWYVLALVLLAIVPFLLALVPTGAAGRVVALALAASVGFVSGAIQGSAFLLMGFLLIPIVALGLILGLIALVNSGRRVEDGSQALAILGLTPAGSGFAVYLVYIQVGLIQDGHPGLLVGSRPVVVFWVSVALAACAVLIVAWSALRRRRAIPSAKSKTPREWRDFDQHD